MANAVLVHLLERKDLGKVLAKFSRTLRKGGICFIRLLDKEIPVRQELDDDGRWFVYFNQEEVHRAIVEAGFEVIDCQAPIRHAKYENVWWIAAILKKP